jgi:hypothetical protein
LLGLIEIDPWNFAWNVVEDLGLASPDVGEIWNGRIEMAWRHELTLSQAPVVRLQPFALRGDLLVLGAQMAAPGK